MADNSKSMKMASLLLATALASSGCHADNSPVLGLLEQVPVVGKDMRVQARTTYIFTNEKLRSATVFTGLQSHGDALSTICCFEVNNTNPVSLQAELSRYGSDPDFVTHMKSIKGYTYIYVARPAPQALWNKFMKNITPSVQDPMDGQIFSAPVVSATLNKDIVPGTFDANGKKVLLRTEYKQASDKAVYVFSVDGRAIEFSENLPNAE